MTELRLESEDFPDIMQRPGAVDAVVTDTGVAGGNEIDLPDDVLAPIAVLDAGGQPMPLEQYAPILVGPRYLFTRAEVQAAAQAYTARVLAKARAERTILVEPLPPGPAVPLAQAIAAAPAVARRNTLEHALMLGQMNRADGAPAPAAPRS